jgi:hypothetical protein
VDLTRKPEVGNPLAVAGDHLAICSDDGIEVALSYNGSPATLRINTRR